jgi:hypothetical protein
VQPDDELSQFIKASGGVTFNTVITRCVFYMCLLWYYSSKYVTVQMCLINNRNIKINFKKAQFRAFLISGRLYSKFHPPSLWTLRRSRCIKYQESNPFTLPSYSHTSVFSSSHCITLTLIVTMAILMSRK